MPLSPPDRITLHAAWVGGGLQHRAFRGGLAGAAGEAAFRPCLADPQAMAAPCQGRPRRVREASLECHPARPPIR